MSKPLAPKAMANRLTQVFGAERFPVAVSELALDYSRQWFTIAHAFGHYLLHRHRQATFNCGLDYSPRPWRTVIWHGRGIRSRRSRRRCGLRANPKR
jgi:hypothetical protein